MKRRKVKSCDNTFNGAVFVYVPTVAAKKVISYSKNFHRLGSKVDFGNHLYKPHIGLYITAFPEENETEIIQSFSSISFRNFSVSFKDIVVEPHGFIRLHCSLGKKEINSLHQKVLQRLNPLRKGILRDKYSKDLSKFTQEQKKMIKKYGSPRVEKLFEPHITIADIEPGYLHEAKKIISSVAFPEISFKVQKISFVKYLKDLISEDRKAKILVQKKATC